MSRRRRSSVLAALLAITVVAPSRAAEAPGYTPSELRVLRSLWIGSLGPSPDDPSNAYDTDPRAAALGRRVFFDTRFSANGALACVSCHDPAASFQDGKPTAEGIGRVARRAMPLLGVAHNTWFFWDGRRDSLWSQALVPLEHPLELGLSRAAVVALVAQHYRVDYDAIFGALPPEPRTDAATTRAFVNVGKAIAAFVRTIEPGPARFDRYVEGLLARAPAGDTGAREGDAVVLRPAEVRGLRLFIGKAKCINCHAGPLFTNGEFHFTRVPQTLPDAGRADAIAEVRAGEFKCLSPYSDAAPEACSALRFIDPDTRDTLRAFKTPTLRNVAVRAPYMSAGQIATLAGVLRFYRDNTHGMKELAHGDLTDAELGDLEAFLGTLTGPVTALAAP